MRRKNLSIVAIAAAMLWLIGASVEAQSLRDDMDGIIHDYLQSHPNEVGQIVKNYMMQHPEMLRDVMSALLKKRVATSPPSPAPDAGAAIKANAAQLLTSAHQVVLGNPKGDVTLVEFFDYSCGFCKRALSDTLTLLKDDPKLRIVLKEFPILGQGSLEAARIAVAVRMQDPTGAKYLEFHRRLLGQPGGASKERALAAAHQAGLDMTRLQKDMDSAEVDATLDESRMLADKVGIHGTPGYIVGDTVIPGAIGASLLKVKISAARLRPHGQLQ
jgi:protein-disulfide isomerase